MSLCIKILICAASVPLLIIPCLADTAPQASITINDDSYDFGYIPIDYRVSHTYYIKNSGNAVLDVTKIVHNCDCTSSTLQSKEIQPGDSAALTVIFHTKNYYGRTTRTVTIHTNDPEHPEYDVSYTADLGMLPGLFKTNPISLIILPSKNEKNISLLNLSDDDIDYEIEYQDNMFFTLDKIGGEIDAEDSVGITLTVNDGVPPGTFYNNFTISYKNDETVRLTVPVKIVKF